MCPGQMSFDGEPEPEFPGASEDSESAEQMGDGVRQVTYREGSPPDLLTPCTWSVSKGQ